VVSYRPDTQVRKRSEQAFSDLFPYRRQAGGLLRRGRLSAEERAVRLAGGIAVRAAPSVYRGCTCMAECVGALGRWKISSRNASSPAGESVTS
jgi:hypothetical protein